MRIVVVGAGALGGLVAGHLVEAGVDAVLLESDEKRAAILNRDGLYILQEGEGERRIPVRVITSVEGQQPVDLVFLAVKSYQTEAAMRAVLPLVNPDTRVLSMQNGIGNADTIARMVRPEQVLCGIFYHSVQHVGANRIRFRLGIKPIQIAPFLGNGNGEVQEICEIFNQAGLRTEIVDNLEQVIWSKILHNAAVNPVSALTGMTCNQMLADAEVQLLCQALTQEIVSVMRALGVAIEDEEDPYRPVIASQRALGDNHPSMWQDLARGVPTEIDAINGAVVREAARLGLSAPVNWTLVRLIHAREQTPLPYKKES